MDRGLGAIDAGLMEYPQFAGGGVVALAGGGDPEDYEGIYGRLKGSKQILGGLLGTGVSAENLSMLRDPSQFSTEEVARLFAVALSKGDLETATPLRYVLRNRGLDDNTLTNIERKTREGLRAQEDVRAQEAQAEKLNVLRTGQPTAPVAAPPAAPVAAPPAPVVERRAPVMAAPAATAPPPKEDKTDDYYKELRDFRQREGLGAAREEMRQFLTSEEKRLEKAYGEDRRMAFADVGFKMAAAASRPGATFLGAMAEGAMNGTQALRAINKEIADNRRLLKQTSIKLKEAEELEKEGDYKAAIGRYKDARQEELKLYELNEGLKNDRAKIELQSKGLDIQSEQAAATRDLTEQYRSGQERDRKIALREQILGRSAYPTLELQAANTDDPEKRMSLQKKMDAIMAEANRRAGLNEDLLMNPQEASAASSPVEYYVPGKGFMKPPGG
jgi:hypothetical protein